MRSRKSCRSTAKPRPRNRRISSLAAPSCPAPTLAEITTIRGDVLLVPPGAPVSTITLPFVEVRAWVSASLYPGDATTTCCRGCVPGALCLLPTLQSDGRYVRQWPPAGHPGYARIRAV